MIITSKKIAAIDKQHEEYVEKQNIISRAIADLTQRVDELKAAAEDAAIAGNIELYKQTISAAHDAETELRVREIQRDKDTGSISEATAKEAWSEYAQAHDRELAKKWDRYVKVREEMYSLYGEMLEQMAEAYAIRARLAEYVGNIERIDSIFQCKEIPRLPANVNNWLKTFGTGATDPDFVFYFCRYAIEHGLSGINIQENPKLAMMNAIHIFHRSEF